jgi:hypothetical protein
MAEWPPRDKQSVYVPPTLPTAPESEVAQRARIAAARVREGLPISDEILSEVLRSHAGEKHVGIFTASEQEDIYGDSERVEVARAALGDVEGVLGSLQVCWVEGRRGIRVLLTGEHERYRQRLSEKLDPERVVIDHALMTEDDGRRLQEVARAQQSALAEQGIFLTMSGQGIEGFEIEYLAWHPSAAEVTLRQLFGDGVILRCRGASSRAFSTFPFASWHAEDEQLHVFYGLPHNGEGTGGCQASEDDGAVVVSLTIKDWRGAKTLIGGFTPSHATVTLARPFGKHVVIDDSANLVRPHWTQT